jgi:hypothetical protein
MGRTSTDSRSWDGEGTVLLTVGLGTVREFPVESRPVFVSHFFSVKRNLFFGVLILLQ